MAVEDIKSDTRVLKQSRAVRLCLDDKMDGGISG